MLFFFGLVFNYLRSIEKTTENTGRIIGIAFKEDIVKNYEKIQPKTHSNEGNGAPYYPAKSPSSEKDILLQKLRDGNLTADESKKLHTILESEAANARASGAVAALLAILGLLALLALLSED